MLRSNSRSRTKWLELAREAERIGVDSVWVPEFWAYDAFTPGCSHSVPIRKQDRGSPTCA